jgi:low temperature requirement protein LtrA
MPVQIAVFMSMVGAVVMAVAAAQGFEQRALVFAGAYAAARISRPILVLAFRLTHKIPVPVLFAISVSAVPWIVGALVDDLLLRGVLWALALVWTTAGSRSAINDWSAYRSRVNIWPSGCSSSI